MMGLAELDSMLTRELAGAENFLAEQATYTPPPPAPQVSVPCVIMFDEPRQDDGGGRAPIVGQAEEITLLRADVPTPVRGGVVTRAAGTWRLTDRLGGNDGHTIWSVTRVGA